MAPFFIFSKEIKLLRNLIKFFNMFTDDALNDRNLLEKANKISNRPGKDDLTVENLTNILNSFNYNEFMNRVKSMEVNKDNFDTYIKYYLPLIEQVEISIKEHTRGKTYKEYIEKFMKLRNIINSKFSNVNYSNFKNKTQNTQVTSLRSTNQDTQNKMQVEENSSQSQDFVSPLYKQLNPHKFPNNMIPNSENSNAKIPPVLKMVDELKTGVNGMQCSTSMNPEKPNLWVADVNHFTDDKRRDKVYNELHCVENCSPTYDSFAEQLNWYIRQGKQRLVLPQVERCLQMRVKVDDMFREKGSSNQGQHAYEIKRINNLRKDILKIGINNIKAIKYDHEYKNFAIIRDLKKGGTRKVRSIKKKQTRRRR